jgi:uncharacterized protein with FMN-binding domain
MKISRDKKMIGFMLVSGVVPLIAYSQVYLTEEQANQSIFPGESFQRKEITLTAEEENKIEDKSGEKVRNTKLNYWINKNKDIVIVDQVLGKHEFITYAVGISQGKVKAIEILEYRETYGYQIKNLEWRKQFVGKNVASPLAINNDIVNISGASLSSKHITGGVKRILQTYETVRARL